MQITHFCNSCISIQTAAVSLLCDPWIGPADENAWLSFPFKDEGADIIAKIKPSYIYVSHLHPDHHDVHTLDHVDRETTILIKKFPDHRLFNKLQAQGFKNVIELDAWTSLTLENELEVVIVPATSMVNSEIEAAISYDIDTSLLVRCVTSDQIFFNNVDNPTSLTALKEVRAFCEETWDKPADIACLPVGAASEYPHCFINIDRSAAARRVISSALHDLPTRIDALGCRSFFMAGGTYVVRGKFASLSRYIAQPTFEEAAYSLSNWTDQGNKLFSLEGGRAVKWSSTEQGWQPVKTGLEKTADKNAYTLEAQHMPYDYRSSAGKVDEFVEKVENHFSGAKQNYDTVLERIGLTQDWTTQINLYEDLKLTKDGDLVEGQNIEKTVILSPKGGSSRQILTLHMDLGLFADLLEGRRNWNGAISGTYILYERTPDEFLPDVPFSLNFLVDRSKQPATN